MLSKRGTCGKRKPWGLVLLFFLTSLMFCAVPAPARFQGVLVVAMEPPPLMVPPEGIVASMPHRPGAAYLSRRPYQTPAVPVASAARGGRPAPVWETNGSVEFDPHFFDPPRFLKYQVPEPGKSDKAKPEEK